MEYEGKHPPRRYEGKHVLQFAILQLEDGKNYFL
jgi:hypothetical protein